MRLDWLEDILAVLDTGSFSAAAERRYLTPSAFTRRIRVMEEALGSDLFDRGRKPVTLLPHVQLLEPDLRDAVRRFRELRIGLSERGAQNANRLTLGCQHALTTMVSPRLAQALVQDGEVEMRIRSGTRSECHLMLLRQEIDFALIYETAEDSFQFDPGLFEKVALGVDAFLPVAREDFGKLSDRGNLPLIVYPPAIYLGEVLRRLVLPNLPSDLATHRVAETGLTPAVLQFIRQGLGIGWLPESVAHEAMARGELQDLRPYLPATTLNVNILRTRTDSSAFMNAAWIRLREQASTISVDGMGPPPG